MKLAYSSLVEALQGRRLVQKGLDVECEGARTGVGESDAGDLSIMVNLVIEPWGTRSYEFLMDCEGLLLAELWIDGDGEHIGAEAVKFGQ